MTEGRIPTKGEPEPPDVGDGTTAIRQRTSTAGTTEEMDVQAYQQQPQSVVAPETQAPGAMGEPEPPDSDGGGA